MPAQPTGTKLVTAFTRGVQGPPGETSPETLEARAFVAEKADEVGTHAEQVSGDLQAVETAATDVESKRQEVAGNKNATDAAKSAAETAASNAIATVTAGRISYATLAEMTAASAADGAVAEIPSGTDAGYYRRTGGAWVKVSGATVPGLDVRVTATESVVGARDIASRLFALTDDDGNFVMDLSADAKVFRILAGILSLLTDGTTRLARHDGVSAVDLLADGTVALPGIVTGTAASPTTDFALADADGFYVLRALASGAGVEVGGFTLAYANGAAQIKDRSGNVVIERKATGTLGLEGLELTQLSRSDLVYGVADAEGFLGWGIAPDGKTLGTEASIGFTADDVLTLDAEARAYTDGLKASLNSTTARPLWAYNLVLSYGQSLSVGAEGWPSLSRTARRNNLMIGSSVRALGASTSTWTPNGSAAFNPLVATVAGDSGALLTPEEQSALAAGSTNAGETPLEGALSFFKLLWDMDKGVASDTSRKFVAAATGVSGKSIEELSKGASPDLYSRVTSCATVAKGISDGLGASIGLPYLIFLQGENNYSSNNGSATDKATYKANLKTLVANLRADVQAAIFGQSDPFGFITYQTGGGYTQDTNDLAIGMAQLELSNEEPNWFLAAPVYPVVDRGGGHLPPNGYRWLGKQFGKVMFRLAKGELWKPLQPIKLVGRGREILAAFHVPAAPLQFGLPYTNGTALDYSDKGFSVIDDSGAVPVSDVAIVAPRVVRLTLSRAPVGAVRLRYADKTNHNGNGNLCDSDATVSDDVYEYTAGSGQTAAENVPALVGKPYPLNNWCVAGHWTVTMES